MPKPLAPAFQPLPFPYSPVLRDAMAEVSRSVEPMLDDLVARYALPPMKGALLLPCATLRTPTDAPGVMHYVDLTGLLLNYSHPSKVRRFLPRN